jgi:hypothetical protein
MAATIALSQFSGAGARIICYPRQRLPQSLFLVIIRFLFLNKSIEEKKVMIMFSSMLLLSCIGEEVGRRGRIYGRGPYVLLVQSPSNQYHDYNDTI